MPAITDTDLRAAANIAVAAECEEWAAAFRLAPECALCGAPLSDADPNTTLCDTCSLQIAEAIAGWIADNRAAFVA